MTAVLLVDLLLLIVIPVLGNELRLWIDDRYNDRSEPVSRHAAGSAGTVTLRALAQRDRRTEDRALFERIAKDFDLVRPEWHTDRLEIPWERM
jgi:hypothetical protein